MLDGHFCKTCCIGDVEFLHRAFLICGDSLGRNLENLGHLCDGMTVEETCKNLFFPFAQNVERTVVHGVVGCVFLYDKISHSVSGVIFTFIYCADRLQYFRGRSCLYQIAHCAPLSMTGLYNRLIRALRA